MSQNESYIIYNGVLKKTEEPVFTSNNRALMYGDGFFETIFAFNNKIPFLSYHLDRINRAIRALHLIPIDLFTDLEELSSIITYLARKNKLYKEYRIRLTVFRNDGGYYNPTDNSLSYFIQTSPLPDNNFRFNTEGLKLGVYRDLTKDYSQLSEFKTLNSLVYVLASHYAYMNRLDDVIILNKNGNIVETSNSNIFFIVDNKIITPRVEDGCVNGIMRHIIIYMLKDQGIDVLEKSVTLDILDKSEEIFLSNSLQGINFVSVFDSKRFINFVSRGISLNLEKKVSLFKS
ncbi:MAG: aminotransferase class IV [Bacteroidales bacterium]|nr:aminotransferase class IV [Bacteroidales bacterium]